MKEKFWLSIFLPSGITWEIGDSLIRTRRSATGKIIMRARHYSGTAESWLSAARGLAIVQEAA